MIKTKILAGIGSVLLLSSGFAVYAMMQDEPVTSQPAVKTEQTVKSSSAQEPAKSEAKPQEEAVKEEVAQEAAEAVEEVAAPAEEVTAEAEAVEEVAAPAPEAEVQEPEASPAPAAEPTPAPSPAPAAPAIQTISFLGGSYHYAAAGRGGGQAAIDSNPGQAPTWGGEASGNVADGLSSHFIGHEYGAFAPVLSLSGGQVITVVDTNGQSRNYTVNGIVDVNDHAIGVNDKVNYWNQITGTGGGERIVLQTCISPTINRIVFAS